MRVLGLSLLLLSVAACGSADLEGVAFDDDTNVVVRSGVAPGTPEASAVLALTNDPATTAVILDVDARLDRRAAYNIIAHRDGADATAGTADDDRFDDLAELDAIKYVGSSALGRLLAYAAEQGYLDHAPAGDEAAVLALVNDPATHHTRLDIDVGLNRRAADNIMTFKDGPDRLRGTADDRLFTSLAQLDAVPYVGEVALAQLLAYALEHGYGQTNPPDDCLIISEYLEGWGNYNKAIELYNCGEAPVRLGDYGLCMARNADTDCTSSVTLPTHTLNAGETYVVCRRHYGTFNDPMQSVVNACQYQASGVMRFNGDDRLLVFRDLDDNGDYDPGDIAVDGFGALAVEPLENPWSETNFRRCALEPVVPTLSFNAHDYYRQFTRGDGSHLGVAPEAGCAPSGGALEAGDDCRATSQCATGLACRGIPTDGSRAVGKCVSTTPVPGEGAPCDQRTPCADGTLCAGTTLWGEGTCVAQWMAGRFIYDQIREMPSYGTTTSSVVVYGLASVPVDITFTMQLQHTRRTDLRVTLTDPNGDSAVLWDHSSELANGVSRSFVTTGISRDDQVNGRWTLTIEDDRANSGGWLHGWDLFIVSRWD